MPHPITADARNVTVYESNNDPPSGGVLQPHTVSLGGGIYNRLRCEITVTETISSSGH